MNKVLILCPKEDFEKHVKQIRDALILMKHFKEDAGKNAFKIVNKYFQTTVQLEHTEKPDLSDQTYDAVILYTKPTKYPLDSMRDNTVFIAGQIPSEEQSGQWDSDDWFLDYFIDDDELGELIGQAPFRQFE